MKRSKSSHIKVYATEKENIQYVKKFDPEKPTPGAEDRTNIQHLSRNRNINQFKPYFDPDMVKVKEFFSGVLKKFEKMTLLALKSSYN